MNESFFSLKPIVNNNSRMLILGTMPGKLSHDIGEYYSDKRNKFWNLIYNVFNSEYSYQPYKEKELFVLQNYIAIWDIYSTCIRNGSIDNNIKKAKLNDLPSFLNKYKNINTILFNGKRSFNEYNRNFNYLNIECKLLPSSSGAHTLKYEHKLKLWMDIFK